MKSLNSVKSCRSSADASCKLCLQSRLWRMGRPSCCQHIAVLPVISRQMLYNYQWGQRTVTASNDQVNGARRHHIWYGQVLSIIFRFLFPVQRTYFLSISVPKSVVISNQYCLKYQNHLTKRCRLFTQKSYIFRSKSIRKLIQLVA